MYSAMFENGTAENMLIIYRRQTRTSEDQLREDFGVFPPAPLQCRSPEFRFVIVHARGPGKLINHWRRGAELMQAFEADRSTVTPGLLDTLITLTGVEKIGQPRESTPLRYRAPRLVVRLFLAICLFKAERTRKSGLGYFLPITSHDRQVTLLAGARRNAELANAVIAHEHLHFLQHQVAMNRSKGVASLPLILAEQHAKNAFVLYLLEPMEVEARLHELILSFYRARQSLPQTVDEFLCLLADWEEFGQYLTVMTGSAGLAMRGTGSVFSLRSKDLGEQLGMVMGFFKNAETTKQFVAEVLPVMYGNLLGYYGDAPASTRFLAQIARPNLYDALYKQKEPSVG